MATEFILCRRVDDHSVTAKIAAPALRFWAGWEPIPAEPEKSTPQPAEAPAEATPARKGESASKAEGGEKPESSRATKPARENRT
jgi:hypothetical protein